MVQAAEHLRGIVHRPRGRYVLCVMTRPDRGTPEELTGVVAELSRIVRARQAE